MSATHQPYSIYVGDDCKILLDLHNADGGPLDLTNATVEWTLYDNTGAVVASMSSAGENPAIIINQPPTAGLAIGTLSKTVTAGLTVGTCYDRVRAILSDQTESTQSVGRVDIKQAGPPIVERTGFTVDDWNSVNDAFATGARSISIGDRSVVLQSFTELMNLRTIIGQELGFLPRKGATILIAHNDGRSGYLCR